MDVTTSAAPQTPAVTYLPWWEFYFRLESLAKAYLAPSYDVLLYVTRGGMTPAHRLAHVLGLSADPDRLRPIAIRRHASDAIQAPALPPELLGDLSGLGPQTRVLLVEDTIGAGATLLCALSALHARGVQSIDVLSVGLDHRDLRAAGKLDPKLAEALAGAAIGFDYAGWMVFPWEGQAAEGYWSPASPAVHLPEAFDWETVSWRNRSLALRRRFIESGRLAAIVGDDDGTLQEAGLLDRILVEGVWASRWGAGRWASRARAIRQALTEEGQVLFAFLDRMRIEDPADLIPGIEYATLPLMARLMAKAGFSETRLLESVGPVTFAISTK